jgi:hypothetical protein
VETTERFSGFSLEKGDLLRLQELASLLLQLFCLELFCLELFCPELFRLELVHQTLLGDLSMLPIRRILAQAGAQVNEREGWKRLLEDY